MRETAALLALTALAAAVRFVALDHQSIWLDEWLSVRLAVKPAAAIVTNPDGEPPLFGLLLHALIRLGHESDWWLRFPSALAGTLAVPLVLLLGVRLRRPAAGLGAAALLAIHPLAVWYAQEARAYAATMLFAVASTGCLIELIRGGGRWWRVAYAVTASLGFGFHYYFGFVVAAHALIALGDLAVVPGRRALWGRTALLTAAALAVWLPGLVSDAAAQAAQDSASRFSWMALPYTALAFVGGFSVGPPLRALHPASRAGTGAWAALRPYLPPTLVALAVATAIVAVPFGRRLAREDRWLLLLMGLPVLGPFAASAVLVGYRVRYALPALPFVLLWATSGLASRRRGCALAALAALVVVEGWGLVQMNLPAYEREDARDAAAWVTARPAPRAVVLVGETSLAFERYARPGDAILEVEPHMLRDGTLPARLAAVAAGAESVFLVSSRPWTVDPRGEVAALLDAELRMREEASFPGVEVRRYGTDVPGGRSAR
jgi:4-amino-4-deoxy-L-arabinose transferase-like glycosyltransferase